MANIAEYLKKIMEARFGKDVRSSIHDGIDAINSEVETNTAASNKALEAATASATAAVNAETAANKAKSDVETVKSEIYETAIPQINQIKSDTELIKQETASIKAQTEQIKNDTQEIKDDTQSIKSDVSEIEKSCAKYAEKCENATESIAGGLIPCGTILFSELPQLSDVRKGWMYNISDEFTSTGEFVDGGDYYYPAGTNVYAVLGGNSLMWDCLGGEMSGYLMKRDFDTVLADTKVEFEEPAELKVASGITTIKNLFGNVAKIIKLLGKTDLSDAGDDVTSILKSLLAKIGNTDISGIGDGTITGGLSMLNSDKIIDLSDGKNTAILEVNGRHCMLTFDGHIVSAKNGSFFSLYNLIPIEYMPKRRHIYSGICALYNDKYYMAYICLLNNNWSGYGVSTSSDGYIYLTGQSSWNGTIEWVC